MEQSWKSEYFYISFFGCLVILSLFLFFFSLWITQLLGLGGSQNQQHKTGKMTAYTKDQVKIATAVATYGVFPLAGFLITRYGRKKR